MDDTEASSWKTPKGSNGVIKLAKSAKISSVQVSGYTNSRFEGLKSFTLQTSTDGVNWKTQPFGGRTPSATRPRGRGPGPALQDVHAAHPDEGRVRQVLGRRSARRDDDERPGRRDPGVQQPASGLTPPPPPPLDAPVSETFTIAVGNPNNLVARA